MAFLYETHMHTSEASACSETSGAEQAREYFEHGYTGIIVTDHFLNGNTAVPRNLPWKERADRFVLGYLNAKAEGEALGKDGKPGLDVFFGWEYGVNHKDFLTYGLGYDFLVAHPELERMNIKDYSKLVHENGGYIAQAHPFREAPYITDPGAVSPEYIDGVETYNASGGHKNYNEKAAAFARKHGLPVQAGSDSHWLNLDFISGIALKQRAESIFDIIRVIKNGEAELIKR